MKPLSPTYTANLFRPLHQELVELLKSMEEEDWRRPTLAPEWRVKDVVAHLLDGDLRRLSFHRDQHPVPSPPTEMESHEDLVSFLDTLNHRWVRASQRLSSKVLVDLVERSGHEVADFVESLDPSSPALFPVAWAGEDQSVNWMDVGREYTERWHHQQQIREAVQAPLLLGEEWMRPLLDLSVRSLAPAFSSIEAPVGTRVQVEIHGDGGGDWIVCRDEDGWNIYKGAGEASNTRVTLSTDTAWRLFYNALTDEGEAGIRVDGDRSLARPLFSARSVMV